MTKILKNLIDFLTKFLDSFSQILKKLTQILKKLRNKLSGIQVEDLTLIITSQNTLGRNITFLLKNNNLLERRDLFNAIYLFLMNNQEFLEFGVNKVIIVNGKIKNEVFNLHHNILIKNDTTFEEYWNKIEDILEDISEDGYAIEGIPMIEINIWNLDHLANKKIKITRNALTGRDIYTVTDKKVLNTRRSIKGSLVNKKFYSTKAPSANKYLNFITPIKPKKSISKIIDIIDEGKPFSAMDIETIDLNGVEIPISISIKTKNKIEVFIIDHIKLLYDLNTALKDLWDKFFDFILKNCDKNVIFVHNLGNFDGFFIYKALSNKFKPEEVSCLIDNHNKFIQITLHIDKLKIVFKDSYRIFPVSLNDLCNILSLPGKTNSYNPEYHKISLFNNEKLLQEFKYYSIQDSCALFDCIYKLQDIYLRDYNVDITTILSTSTLSMKIFRSKFLKVNIPILKRLDDTFIRNSYFGGATDYYQLKATNIHYYDVNSLYPFSMIKPMPFELIRKITFKEGDSFNLDNFFGFLKVEVNCPLNVKIPVLPCKYKGKTIFPTGIWIGTYFSEELKAVLKYGYTFKFIKAYEFSKIDLFSDYVNHFYEQKRNSIGPERFIAKMHLNQLYGILGRKHDLLETRNIYKKDLQDIIITRVVKTIIPINDKIVSLLMHSNIKNRLISKLNSELDIKLNNYYNLVRANVALASAVTSYSRIHMIPFKVDGKCVYSDTDSVFMTEPLPNKFIGNDLGFMKDELKGLIIKEAYFLGIKKYAYQYEDKKGNLITKSVFAGIQRDSLTFDEIIKLSQGETLVKEIPLRFYKSLKTLSISINITHLNISRSLDKKLVNNNYIPLHLDTLNSYSETFYNYLKRKLLNILKNIFKF